MLYNQSIKGNVKTPSDKIEALLPQKPNKKILKTFNINLFWYRLGYNRYLNKKDDWQAELNTLNANFNKAKENNLMSLSDLKKAEIKFDHKTEKLNKKIENGTWFMRNFGEPPSYFYTEDALKNTEKIRKYLFHNGFFQAKVGFKTDTSYLNKNYTNVVYQINEGNDYTISKNDSLITSNENINNLLIAHQKESHFTLNEHYSLDKQNAEKIRIENLLKNNGYYHFSKEDVQIKIDQRDSSNLKTLKIITIIPPENKKNIKNNFDKIYSLENVTMFIDGSQSNDVFTEKDTITNSHVKYIFINKKFNTNLLNTKISLYPNELYSKDKELKTQKNLYNLDQFKYANITYDTTGGKLKATIHTQTLDKYQFTGEGGGSVFQRVIGPFTYASLKVRNVFGGLEALDVNIRAGYEGQPGFLESGVTNNLDLSLSNTLQFPQALLPNKWAAKLSDFQPKTQIGLGANYLVRQEFTRLNFKASLIYQWQPTPNKSISISPIDISYVNTPSETASFNKYLTDEQSKGNNIYLTFKPSFISTINANYTYNSNLSGIQNTKAKYFKLFVEIGGSTLNLTSSKRFGFIDNLFATSSESLTFYRFVKIGSDWRLYKPLGVKKKSSLAFRLNTGIGYAYDEGGVLPYEKNFFAGGSNSLRAWKPRQLRAGNSSADSTINSARERPGNVLIESSLEFRFRIMRLAGDLNGAFFVDAGNVWTLDNINQKASEAPTNFNFKNFTSQIAAGVGFGIRWDFSFLILRFDMSAKMIDPSQVNSNKFVLFNQNFYKNSESHIGIGYPF
ncbi:MAG: BamA/TamA family outer membrane protein [Pseudarcicella sp.]|nr:BamA/TamA family outer membrane protein [Pseudarcicella sp.]MBP6410845.1 BamA/TamA family outer membrane protein [Pseudarcicella sp.]